MAIPTQYTQDAAHKAIVDSVSPFGKLQVSQITPTFSLLPRNEVSHLRNRILTSGTGSINSDRQSITLSTGSTSGSEADLWTQQWGRYVPGLECSYGVRAQIPQSLSGTQKVKFGPFNENNGVFWQEEKDGLYLIQRRAGSQVSKIKSTNLAEPMPTQHSTSKSVIYRFPFTHYGAGMWTPSVYMTNTGNNRYIHKTVHAFHPDSDGTPVVEQPNLPVRVKIENGNTTEDIKVNVIGRHFMIMGDYDPSRREIGERIGKTGIGTSFEPILSYRFKNGWEPEEVKVSEVEVIPQSEDVEYQVRFNTTISGSSFRPMGDLDSSETPVEIDESGTSVSGANYSITGMSKSGSAQGSKQLKTDEPNPVPVPKFDTITLVAKAITGTSTDIDAILKLRADM